MILRSCSCPNTKYQTIKEAKTPIYRRKHHYLINPKMKYNKARIFVTCKGPKGR